MLAVLVGRKYNNGDDLVHLFWASMETVQHVAEYVSTFILLSQTPQSALYPKFGVHMGRLIWI